MERDGEGREGMRGKDAVFMQMVCLDGVCEHRVC